ncbi:MAG: sensor domain-containing diguanylate cyclase [Polyangiales bacterium]
MFGWLTERVARRAAFIAALSTAVCVLLPFVLLGAHVEQAHLVLGVLVVVVPLAAVTTGHWVDLIVGNRIRVLKDFLADQSRASSDHLHRLPHLGDDELGVAADAANRLLTHFTDVHVSMIDQRLELEEAQEKLALKEQIEKKSRELEARLRERAVLFEILQESTRRPDLQKMLSQVALKLGPALRLRELAILVREEEALVIRAVHGFPNPTALLGREVQQGEGVAGDAAEGNDPVLVRDVRTEPKYLAFWGEAERTGSYAAVPVMDGKRRVGMLALTRPPDDPLLPEEVRFAGAVGDTLALAIRHGRQMEELRALSMHDELTGLANRRLLKSRIQMELTRARRFRHAVSVLAIDIDHFKLLNDRCGHPVGDEALRSVGAILEDKIRRVDTVARIGGEEFVVLLPRTSSVHALKVAEHLRAAVANHPFSGADGQPGGRLTISVGVAELLPAEEPSDFLARADAALYAAKGAGRDRVVLHSDHREQPIEAE